MMVTQGFPGGGKGDPTSRLWPLHQKVVAPHEHFKKALGKSIAFCS